LKFLPDIDPVTYKDLPDRVKICLSGQSVSTAIVRKIVSSGKNSFFI
jgi:hypothetical protein